MTAARLALAAAVILGVAFLATIAWPRSTGSVAGEALPETPTTRAVGTTVPRLTVRSGQGWFALPSAQSVQEAVDALPPPTTQPPATVPPTTAVTLPPAPEPVVEVELAPAIHIERSDLEALICSYSWPCDTALRIARCESQMNPGAVGSAGERGLFQIHPVHAPALGERWPRMFEPAVNVATAHAMWQAQGFGPWSCA